jgi:hypothetical protein
MSSKIRTSKRSIFLSSYSIRCSATLSCLNYFPAVLRDIPGFIAHMLIVLPCLRSMTSLVNSVHVTTA